MSYRVRTDNFEGPFDLLLYLVNSQKVNIGSIAIAEIADQYLAEIKRMQSLDLNVASDFLLVAATLLEIKAQHLIPVDTDEIDDEIAELAPSEARDILVARLIRYKKYKNVATMLNARFEQQERMHPRTCGPDAAFTNLMPDFLRNITLNELALTAAEAFARQPIELLESDHIAEKPLPVETQVRAVRQRLQREKRLRFSDLADETTPTPLVVVTFLALLELYKRSFVRLEQTKTFGDILIDYIEEADDRSASSPH